MNLHSHFTTVTPLSKKIALFLFFLLPIIAFIFGREYEYLSVIKNGPIPTPTPKMKQENKLHIWKTYKSEVGKLSFEYPSSWKIEESSKDFDKLVLISPDGFTFYFRFGGIQGGPTLCKIDRCPQIENFSIKPIIAGKNQIIYLVHGRYNAAKYLNNSNTSANMSVYASNNLHPDYAVEAGAGIYYDFHIKSKFSNQGNMAMYSTFYGEYPSESYQQKLSPEEYFRLEDVRVADQIINSITFQ